MKDFTTKELGMLQRLISDEVCRLKDAQKNIPKLNRPFYNQAIKKYQNLLDLVCDLRESKSIPYEYNPDDAEMREDITFESSYKEFDGSEI